MSKPQGNMRKFMPMERLSRSGKGWFWQGVWIWNRHPNNDGAPSVSWLPDKKIGD